MQLNVTTDYAIRSLLFLALAKKPVIGPEIAESMKIPQPYLMTIMTKLKKVGFVDSKRGNTGGYYLAKPPEEITLLNIIEAVEGTIRINRCLEEDAYCSRFATANCPVRNVYKAMQNSMEEGFRSVTLKNLKDQL